VKVERETGKQQVHTEAVAGAGSEGTGLKHETTN
jgi:hypothetical protein